MVELIEEIQRQLDDYRMENQRLRSDNREHEYTIRQLKDDLERLEQDHMQACIARDQAEDELASLRNRMQWGD